LSHQLTSRAAPTHSLIRYLLQSYHCRQKDHPRPRGSPSSCLPLARPRRASTGCRSQRFASTGCAVCRDTLRAARGPHREHRLPAQWHIRVKTRRCCHHGALAVTRRRGACPHRILARACPTCGERHHRNLVRNRQHTAPRRTQRCTAATCTPSAGSRLRADIAEASARRVTPQALQPGSCSQSLFFKKVLKRGGSTRAAEHHKKSSLLPARWGAQPLGCSGHSTPCGEHDWCEACTLQVVRVSRCR